MYTLGGNSEGSRMPRAHRNLPSNHWDRYRCTGARGGGGDAVRYRRGSTRAAMQLYELQRLSHELQMLRLVVAESDGRDDAAAILNRALRASDSDWLEVLRATPKQNALNAAIDALPVLPYPQSPLHQLLSSNDTCASGTGAEPLDNSIAVPMAVSAEAKENLPTATAELVVHSPEDYFLESHGKDGVSALSCVSVPSDEMGNSKCGDENDSVVKNDADELEKIAYGWRVASECCICLDAFQEAEPVLHMPCFHSYHPACIKQWLQHQHSCPVCRHDILKLAPATSCGADRDDDDDDATVPTLDNSLSDDRNEDGGGEEEEGAGNWGSFSSEAAVVGSSGRSNTSHFTRRENGRRHRNGRAIRNAASEGNSGSNFGSSSSNSGSSSSSDVIDALTTLLLGTNEPAHESTPQQQQPATTSPEVPMSNSASVSTSSSSSSSTRQHRPPSRNLSRAAALAISTSSMDAQRQSRTNGPVSFFPLRSSRYASRERRSPGALTPA